MDSYNRNGTNPLPGLSSFFIKVRGPRIFDKIIATDPDVLAIQEYDLHFAEAILLFSLFLLFLFVALRRNETPTKARGSKALLQK